MATPMKEKFDKYWDYRSLLDINNVFLHGYLDEDIYMQPPKGYMVPPGMILNHPCELHLSAAMHVVRYLRGCPFKGLFLLAHTDFTLADYCDADWASCIDSRYPLLVSVYYWARLKFPEKPRKSLQFRNLQRRPNTILWLRWSVRPGVILPQSYLWGSIGIGGVDDADNDQQTNENTEHAAIVVARKELITWLDNG
ncbi:UNVERIFIED_CONTAM: hypothetical protein Scaly_2834100 [Sesamum calycinum]|uniref:Uncharacterized protein n=1 Tax=Sesamum calycinum TaxID=2727403 RepID=A0AAW2IT18_9LAMI